MVEGAKEAVGSMGDDTPLAVISDKPRLISQFFRQNFSQVTNPPIDPLRERQVMTLKTRFGNLANILDLDGAQSRVLVLDSPVLTCANWDRLKAHFGVQAAEIDCSFRGRRWRRHAARCNTADSGRRPNRRCARGAATCSCRTRM